jgi:hypothetical protein
MCLLPIRSYFTEYGGGRDLVLLGSVMRPSINHSDITHQPTYLIATPLTSSNVKVTKYQGMRNTSERTLNVFIGQITFSNQAYNKSPRAEGVRL